MNRSYLKLSDTLLFVDERTECFNKFINEKFSDKKLIYILQLIQKRIYKEIQEFVTDDTDIQTIFEYILGADWYKLVNVKAMLKREEVEKLLGETNM